MHIAILAQGEEEKADQPCLYLIPGQGSDFRIFQELDLETQYKLVYIHTPVPEKGMSMHEYAETLVTQFDTSNPFGIIGVSLGGMLAVELNSFINPEITIIISSAASDNDLPVRYKLLKYLPLYKVVPANLIKASAFVAQPLFEPDRKHNKDTFVSMLQDKDPQFMKRSIPMIVNWNPEESKKIVHIHGTKDHTIPYRNTSPDYVVFSGSHMMTLTQAEIITSLILDALNNVEL